MAKSAYKLAHLNKAAIISAARKALMTADPHYYSWPASQQEKFRATMNDEARLKIERVLLEQLLDIKCTKEEAKDIWNNLPIAKLNPLNWASLLTKGIGEDCIFLNEIMPEEVSLLDFKILYDYDHDDYLYQESAHKKQSSDYAGSEYYALKHQSWARLLIDENFYYGHITSLATHIFYEVESAGNDHIDQLIPHKYVDGKDQGKKTERGILWDMEVDANGQEAQLDELKNRWHTYQQESWLDFNIANKKLPPAVYTQDTDWDNDPNRIFIFNNEVTVKKIRWKHFLADCEPLLKDYSVVEVQIKQEAEIAKSWLTENHQDIMENFDPKVVKLKKKRQIVMTDQALEDMARIESDEEDTE